MVKDFVRSFKFKVFVVIALMLIGLIIRTASNGGFASYTADGFNYILAPLQKASSSVSGFFSGFVSDIINFRSMKDENEDLKKQISEYQSKMVNYNDMLRENQQLESVLDLHKSNPDFKLLPASVISRDQGQWFSSFTIDKGSLDGVKYQDAIITADNDLVGKVTQIYANSAVVSTILDPAVQAGVFISETGDMGQSQGDLTLLAKDQFKVSLLPKNSNISPGNIIVTSGRGGIFPKNLKVGTVESVSNDNTGNTLNAACRPMAIPSTLKDVFILSDFNGKDKTAAAKGGGS